ncbi:hypothetical protein HO173_007579 [Letharia columbiana]|uniref:Uncharacterized protein n=1 Tax=Letharia columbiana TaxID=112416 RepID=A0A8H6FT12_9LECA|nr:uncharacterized protein HO173_007579 [Letharia columbiana]KAF6234159.1 hypothetical protein HO173_007579 [Letharia columbiana]
MSKDDRVISGEDNFMSLDLVTSSHKVQTWRLQVRAGILADFSIVGIKLVHVLRYGEFAKTSSPRSIPLSYYVVVSLFLHGPIRTLDVAVVMTSQRGVKPEADTQQSILDSRELLEDKALNDRLILQANGLPHN